MGAGHEGVHFIFIDLIVIIAEDGEVVVVGVIPALTFTERIDEGREVEETKTVHPSRQVDMDGRRLVR